MTNYEFSERLEQIYSRLWSTAAATVGDCALAEDIVQEAALQALRKLDDFTPGTSFAAWMTAFVRNVGRNFGRKHHRNRGEMTDPAILSASVEVTDFPEEYEFEELSKGVLLHADQRLFDDAMYSALMKLPTTVRICVLLRIVAGASFAEIAESLQIPEGTAMSHVHRALKTLRKSFSTKVSDDCR